MNRRLLIEKIHRAAADVGQWIWFLALGVLLVVLRLLPHLLRAATVAIWAAALTWAWLVWPGIWAGNAAQVGPVRALIVYAALVPVALTASRHPRLVWGGFLAGGLGVGILTWLLPHLMQRAPLLVLASPTLLYGVLVLILLIRVRSRLSQKEVSHDANVR